MSRGAKRSATNTSEFIAPPPKAGFFHQGGRTLIGRACLADVMVWVQVRPSNQSAMVVQ
jgi:hypothetical protein